MDNHSNRFAENQFVSAIKSNEQASYYGSIEASQALEVGSIPIARSINHDDPTVLKLLTSENRRGKGPFCTKVGTYRLPPRKWAG